MTKSRAALNHLWPSILLLAVIGGVTLFIWYPYPFLQIQDSSKFALLLVLAGGFIGPALTWLVYTKGKRDLIIDLSVIVIIQLAAVAWGANALFQNRPYFMIFTVDRFEVLSRREVDTTGINDPKLLDKPVVGPIMLYANMPKDERLFQEFLQGVMFEGKPDLQFRPEFWSRYTERQQLALQQSLALIKLQNARPKSVNAIDKLVEKNGGDINKLNFVPVMLKNAHFAAILDAESGEIVDSIAIDPWVN